MEVTEHVAPISNKFYIREEAPSVLQKSIFLELSKSHRDTLYFWGSAQTFYAVSIPARQKCGVSPENKELDVLNAVIGFGF
jgi:hypothetical protein